MQYNDSRILEHARPDWITRLLRRAEPKFESARQFGFFCRVLGDEWAHGTPGLSSPQEALTEIARLGCIVDRTPSFDATPLPHIDHRRWIVPMLERVCDEVGEPSYHCWEQVDVYARTERQVADHGDWSQSTVHRSVVRVRDAIRNALAGIGRLHT